MVVFIALASNVGNAQSITCSLSTPLGPTSIATATGHTEPIAAGPEQPLLIDQRPVEENVHHADGVERAVRQVREVAYLELDVRREPVHELDLA